jgi:cytochrome c oxidase cbb3-type subunit 2
MKMRLLVYTAVALIAVWVFAAQVEREQSAGVAVDQVSFGRAVYISEGCIHCHSQFIRPVGQDQTLWGQQTPVERALEQSPVLIGNRRQGPDLANVGLRRVAGWNRLHLIEPSAVVPGSRMPSYRHLFTGNDPRGEALLAYLDSLQPE